MIAFAARCALRALPSAGNRESRTSGHIALPALRAILTTGVAAVKPGAEVTAAAAVIFKPSEEHVSGDYHSGDFEGTEFVRAATDSAAAADAYRGAIGAFGSAVRAIAYTSRIVSYEHEVSNIDADEDTEDTILPEGFTDAVADEASEAIEAAASYDAAILVDNAAPELAFNRRLWGNVGIPPWFEPARESLIDAWTSEPAVWGFWARWYQGMLDGEPLDWDLQRAVALIDDAVWTAGPEAVAERIRDIEAEFIVERLPQAEEMVFDAGSGTFEVHPVETSDERLVATTFGQVEFAVRTALQSNCGLNTNSTAYLYIRHTLDNCRDDPNAIEQNLEISTRDIEAGLASGDYSEDSRLTALHSVLERAVLDMRSNHSAVADAWKKRTAFALKSLKAEQKRFILESTIAVAPVMGERQAAEQVMDARTAAGSGDGEVQATALRRWLNRFARMRLIARSAEVIRRINDHAAYLGARILQVLNDIWAFIGGLF
jgi:hypothetical protein